MPTTFRQFSALRLVRRAAGRPLCLPSLGLSALLISTGTAPLRAAEVPQLAQHYGSFAVPGTAPTSPAQQFSPSPQAASTQPSRQPAPARQLSAAPPAATAAYGDLYILGPGDQLQLSFLDPGAKEIGGPVAILPDGTSTLALLGSVQLTGLTLGQATRWLTSIYARELVRPQLILSLVKGRQVQVSVLGEVSRPGLYPLDAYANPVTAIQTAGGITLNADIRQVVLRRLGAAGGQEKQTVLDLAQLLQAGNQRQNPILFDGDTLIVARTDSPLPDEVLQIGLSNLSPATINVTLLGEVKAPGTIAVPSNTPLQEALMRAGGPVPWRANKTDIELVRLNRNGTSTSEFYSYKPGQDISKGFNPPLRDRDTIIVRRSIYGKSVDLLNQVVLPLSSLGNTLLFYTNYWNNNNN
jgi:polysaccharide export outer membrane protein